MFVVPGELRLPIDGDALFGRAAPLVLEIGFGNGWFLVHLGKEHPELNILGAETSASSVHRAYRRLLRADVPAVRIFKGDAVFMIRHLIAPGSLDKVYVNFPDPWPRRKHRSKRLLTAEFFRAVSNRLVPGGTVVLTTDHPEYFAFARKEAVASEVFEESIHEVPAPMLQTRYAQKWLRQKKPIFHGVFSCTTSLALSVPKLRDESMQHALLLGDLDTVGVMPTGVFKVRNAYVIMMEHLCLAEGAGHVFAMHVEEEGLKQDILVEAVVRDNGVFVGVRRFGSPMATHGVGEALRIVVEWLQSRGLTVVDRWYNVPDRPPGIGET
jgi:tRNA (guanine-N7-)-methyltransferase